MPPIFTQTKQVTLSIIIETFVQQSSTSTSMLIPYGFPYPNSFTSVSSVMKPTSNDRVPRTCTVYSAKKKFKLVQQYTRTRIVRLVPLQRPFVKALAPCFFNFSIPGSPPRTYVRPKVHSSAHTSSTSYCWTCTPAYVLRHSG